MIFTYPYMNAILFCIFVWGSSVIASAPPRGPAVFNGETWVSVTNDVTNAPGDPRPPLPTISHADPSQAEIFIGILSYRDPRCGETLTNLFKRAKHPERVHIGLVQERSYDDVECIKTYCQSTGYDLKKCPHINQISTISQSHFETKSYSRGRSMVFHMLKDEEFCLSTESNVEVVQGWDVEMIQMWLETENEYGVLSVYPAVSTSIVEDTVKYSSSNNNMVPHMCQASFYSTAGLNVAPELLYNENQGVVENLAPRSAVNLEKPLLTSLYSASFSFSKCHMERKVPWDPFNENIDKGDDFIKYARLWTKGYDTYTPNKVLLVLNNRNVPKLVGSKGPENKEKDKYEPLAFVRNGMTPLLRRQHKEDAIARMNLLLGSRKSFWNLADNRYNLVSADELLQLTHYGLGYKRSLDQLIAYTGIDTRSRVVFEDKCKRLNWVPFVIDTDPNTDESDPWGSAPEKIISSAIAPGVVNTEPGGVGSNHYSASFNKIIHGSTVPLLTEGKKKHVSSVYVTDKQQRDALMHQMEQNAATAAANRSSEKEQSALIEPEVPVAVPISVLLPPSPMVAMWKSGLGWWFDDWMTLAQTLLMFALPREIGTRQNTTKVIKVMLMLFPVVLCMILGGLSVLGDDGSVGEDEEQYVVEESQDEDNEADEEANFSFVKREADRGRQKKKIGTGTPSSTRKKHHPTTPMKRMAPKSDRNN